MKPRLLAMKGAGHRGYLLSVVRRRKLSLHSGSCRKSTVLLRGEDYISQKAPPRRARKSGHCPTATRGSGSERERDREAPGVNLPGAVVGVMPKAKGKSRRQKFGYSVNRKRLNRNARRKAAPRIEW